jgi:hypothetical protein
MHRPDRPAGSVHTQQPGLALRADFHFGHSHWQRPRHAKPKRTGHKGQQHEHSGQMSDKTAHDLA